MKKFEKIYDDLKVKIDSGIYPVGSFLPSETYLASFYQVSRETLRKAQNLLQEEGRIKKIHGRGAKVLDFGKFEISTKGISSFSELSYKYGDTLSTKIVKHKKEFPSPQIYGSDELSTKESGIAIERLRYLNNEAIILDKDFFLLSVIKEDIPKNHVEKSIYQYLEKECKLKIGFAKKEITIEHPPDEIKLLLDLKKDTHVVVTRSKVFLDNAKLFQLHESFQRVDTFHLTDLARR